MSEKISTRELMRSMATHLGVSAAASAAFVEAFQEVFEEALLRDKVVKVNDLGTFKLTWHAPRRSVNVRTGEEMEIAGHYKISFLPDGGWGEKVNEPLAHLEAVELMGETPVAAPSVEDVDHELPEAASDEAPIDFEMPMQHLNEQVTEVKSILMDIMGESVEPEAAAPAVGETENLQQGETADESPVAESQPTAEPTAEPVAEEAAEPTAEPAAEESDEDTEESDDEEATEEQAEEPFAAPVAEEAEEQAEEPSAEPIAEEAEMESEEPTAEPIAEEDAEESEEPTAEPVAEPTVLPIVEKPESSSAETAAVPSQPVGTKGNHRWIGWLVCTLLVLTLLGVGGYYYQTHPEAFSFLKPSESEALVAVQEPVVEDTIPVAVPKEIVYDSTYYFPPEMGNEIFDKPRKFDVFVAVRTITPEDRLVTLAKDYYGHKFFWVYIYEANRDIINHPNKLLVGQQIRIPKMAEELINLNDTACLSYVKKLGDSYVKQ